MSLADGTAWENESCLCVSAAVRSNPDCPVHGKSHNPKDHYTEFPNKWREKDCKCAACENARKLV